MSEERKIYVMPVVVSILLIAGVVMLAFKLTWPGITLIIVAFLLALGVVTGVFAAIEDFLQSIYRDYPQ